ncbi:uncharacterized protein (TIGR02466 family) [Pseudoduganella lurida]|uniref:Uncharacterized protein (TIGR02466 family) n=1 Tax=Pseudoduganella lurida TaxID=1036180 RepID=A0A562RAT0_9BURK|nr:putative 2OG-Fe(II) oxygenase [Pseudoduganella lurida]TWI66148.1 uncharacterized protein (TIGR02466 family) [Pseudoduganella lurida]
MDQLIGLFPTPFLSCTGLLDAAEAAELAAWLRMQSDQVPNSRSDRLTHSAPLRLDGHPLLAMLAERLAPRLVALGEQMFGAALDWSIKELWGNRMAPGGSQGVHRHANSFISGVVYVTTSDASARTVFLRGLGGNDFAFSHAGPGVEVTAFNADRWVAPAGDAGDAVLFPSYLLHEVPANAGGERLTLAFNAIPAQLASWDYAIRFSTGRSS